MHESTDRDDPLEDYSQLLQVRLQAERRRSRLIGSVFLLTIVGYVALGILGMIEGKTAYLSSIFPIAFGFGYVTASRQSSILKETIDLVAEVRRAKTHVAG
jgi:hypothetical protein